MDFVRLFEIFKNLNLSNLIFWIILIVIVRYIWTSNTQKKYGLVGSIIFVAIYYFGFQYIKGKVTGNSK